MAKSFIERYYFYWIFPSGNRQIHRTFPRGVFGSLALNVTVIYPRVGCKRYSSAGPVRCIRVIPTIVVIFIIRWYRNSSCRGGVSFASPPRFAGRLIVLCFLFSFFYLFAIIVIIPRTLFLRKYSGTPGTYAFRGPGRTI